MSDDTHMLSHTQETTGETDRGPSWLLLLFAACCLAHPSIGLGIVFFANIARGVHASGAFVASGLLAIALAITVALIGIAQGRMPLTLLGVASLIISAVYCGVALTCYAFSMSPV